MSGSEDVSLMRGYASMCPCGSIKPMCILGTLKPGASEELPGRAGPTSAGSWWLGGTV